MKPLVTIKGKTATFKSRKYPDIEMQAWADNPADMESTYYRIIYSESQVENPAPIFEERFLSNLPGDGYYLRKFSKGKFTVAVHVKPSGYRFYDHRGYDTTRWPSLKYRIKVKLKPAVIAEIRETLKRLDFFGIGYLSNDDRRIFRIEKNGFFKI